MHVGTIATYQTRTFSSEDVRVFLEYHRYLRLKIGLLTLESICIDFLLIWLLIINYLRTTCKM